MLYQTSNDIEQYWSKLSFTDNQIRLITESLVNLAIRRGLSRKHCIKMVVSQLDDFLWIHSKTDQVLVSWYQISILTVKDAYKNEDDK